MKSNDILLIGGLGLAGLAAYMYFSSPSAPPQAGSGATFIPPNQNVGGYLNTTGAPVWVTATGVVMNGLGQILSSIPWNSITNQGGAGSGTSAGATQPQYNPFSPIISGSRYRMLG